MKITGTGLTLALLIGFGLVAESAWGIDGKVAQPLGPLASPSSFADGDDDDDDDDPRPPVLNAGLGDVDASPPVLLLSGRRICDAPRVRAADRDGVMLDLVVFNSGSDFVQAELAETEPGTYRVVVVCPSGRARLDVTLGTVGPQGPPGDGGFPAGQICPDGTFATGFDLDGSLRCAARPILEGMCPCFTDDTVAELEQIIRRTLENDPDVSALGCSAINDFTDVLLQSYPASGAESTEIDLFGRDDTCGVLRRVPGEGQVQSVISPLSPEEAAVCREVILGLGQRLGCFEP